MASDTVVLSYYDSLVRKSDFALLDSPNWLNDIIIGFSFEYFANEQFAKSSYSFISPEVTQFMKFSSVEELGIFLEPLELKDKNAVFLAVNDNVDAEKTGGSHWSLLVYIRAGNRFEHYDSSSGSNESCAKLLAKKMWSYLGSKIEPHFREVDFAPQQVNSHDCGVYVISVASFLAENLLNGVENINSIINPNFVANKRKELKQLILKLSKENQ